MYVTLIARRSKEFAGTRFLKRGANDKVSLSFNAYFPKFTTVKKNKISNSMEVLENEWHIMHVTDKYSER